MKNQYVILTGSKNNAGDFLIKFRAKQLFKKLRSDRKIIDYNGWEAFDDKKLQTINKSKALLLVGGPALIKGMRDRIYKMTNNLNDIKVPIIFMGIGWKSYNGEWRDTYKYSLDLNDIELLEKINSSGYMSSVRDYHTLNSLRFAGFNNFTMTGCPAYYDLDYINKPLEKTIINKVAFSLGVSFIESPSMEKLMKENILKIKEQFKNKEFEVVFHHSLDREKILSVHGSNSKHNKKHNQFALWLESKNINYIDISGSAENLINYYSTVDLHIGYRVHAHIFMNSISRFSILLSEDGRAKAVKNVIGGIVLDGFSSFQDSFISKIFNRLFDFYDRYIPNSYLTKELLDNVDYEKNIGYVRIKNSRTQIDNNFIIMQEFLKQLP
tara:strand:- start:1180 stop:2325 length:1146 start_codon:yes stop_codon:yes gene_type:complete